MFKSVVLPAPFGPIRPTISPALQSSDTPLTAGVNVSAHRTTRITRQTKRLAGTPANEMLAYWTQAETLCLALPE